MLIALALAIADPELARLAAADARVADTAWRLQTANLGLCPDVRRLAGFSIQTIGQYPVAQRAAAAAAYGLRDRPGVAAVASGSNAARAGLQVGDSIVAIAGVPVFVSVPAAPSYDATATMQAQVAVALGKGPLTLTIARAGGVRDVVVRGDAGCASEVEITPERTLNGRADGRYVQLSGTLVDFAASDDELALVMAHELAHNILGHRARLDAAGITRHGRQARSGRAAATLRGVELEADRLGVWLTARAGYTLDAAIAVWTRLRTATARERGDDTHPDWDVRITNVAQAVAEVRAQQAAGRPLVPPPAVASDATQQSASPASNLR